MTDHPDRIEHALEVLLYAPIGVGMFLKETAPTFVNMFVAKGRAEFDRRQGEVRQRVTTARSTGQVAMAFGPPMVRQKVEQSVTEARRKAEGLFGSPETEARQAEASAAASPAPPAAPAVPEAPAPAPAPSTSESVWHAAASITPKSAETEPSVDLRGGTAVSNGDASARAELPIPGYDALSASQVVERLIGLLPDELNAVHVYESTHRQRRTILGKIEQLAG